jgi:MYXO-CTERM domain-containing protein
MNWLAYSVGTVLALLLMVIGAAALGGVAAFAYQWQAGAPYIVGALALAAIAVLFAIRRRAPAPAGEAPEETHAKHLLMMLLNGVGVLVLVALHVSHDAAFYGVLMMVAGAFAWVLYLTSGLFA